MNELGDRVLVQSLVPSAADIGSPQTENKEKYVKINRPS